MNYIQKKYEYRVDLYFNVYEFSVEVMMEYGIVYVNLRVIIYLF